MRTGGLPAWNGISLRGGCGEVFTDLGRALDRFDRRTGPQCMWIGEDSPRRAANAFVVPESFQNRGVRLHLRSVRWSRNVLRLHVFVDRNQFDRVRRHVLILDARGLGSRLSAEQAAGGEPGCEGRRTFSGLALHAAAPDGYSRENALPTLCSNQHTILSSRLLHR